MELKAKHSYSVLLKKGSSVKDIRFELKLDPLKAPVTINAPIGKLIVYQRDQVLQNLTWMHLYR